MRTADPLSSARTMLRAATGALHSGSGWTMSYRSVYTAHAVYRMTTFTAHVIGTPDGRWWWAAQPRPGLVGPRYEAGTALAACVAAKAAARAMYRAHQRRIKDGQQSPV